MCTRYFLLFLLFSEVQKKIVLVFVILLKDRAGSLYFLSYNFVM